MADFFFCFRITKFTRKCQRVWIHSFFHSSTVFKAQRAHSQRNCFVYRLCRKILYAKWWQSESITTATAAAANKTAQTKLMHYISFTLAFRILSSHHICFRSIHSFRSVSLASLRINFINMLNISQKHIFNAFFNFYFHFYLFLLFQQFLARCHSVLCVMLCPSNDSHCLLTWIMSLVNVVYAQRMHNKISSKTKNCTKKMCCWFFLLEQHKQLITMHISLFSLLCIAKRTYTSFCACSVASYFLD